MPLLPNALLTQDAAYHAFSDQRVILGIANFWNVISNAAFLAPAIAGLATWRGLDTPRRVLTIAAPLIALGSTYYHLAPTDATLYWDRLPMTIAFMSVAAAAINPALLAPLIAIGLASVEIWRQTGDLTAYAAVQFGPMLLLLMKPAWRPLIAVYAAAKLLEHFDAALFQAIGVSGHTLKHIAAALALWIALSTARLSLRSEPQALARGRA